MGDSVSHEASPSDANLDAPRWEIAFYEDILRRDPNYVEVLMQLGNLYTGRKQYDKGLRVDERLATLKKDDPIVHYNLACSYALLKQVDPAFRALSKAVGLGYRDVEHMQRDEDLDGIRSDRRYTDLVARIQGGRRRSSHRP